MLEHFSEEDPNSSYFHEPSKPEHESRWNALVTLVTGMILVAPKNPLEHEYAVHVSEHPASADGPLSDADLEKNTLANIKTALVALGVNLAAAFVTAYDNRTTRDAVRSLLNGQELTDDSWVTSKAALALRDYISRDVSDFSLIDARLDHGTWARRSDIAGPSVTQATKDLLVSAQYAHSP